MSDEIVPLLQNALKASEELVRAQAAHIKKLELEVELFKAAYQAAAQLASQATTSPGPTLLDEIQERARRKSTD